jgi:hypothetical protein
MAAQGAAESNEKTNIPKGGERHSTHDRFGHQKRKEVISSKSNLENPWRWKMTLVMRDDLSHPNK